MKEKKWYKPRKHKKMKAWKKVLLIILAVILLAALAVAGYVYYQARYGVWKPVEMTDEKLLEMAPTQTEKSAKINAMSQYPQSDTWAFYVYIIGADLEDMGINELSSMTQLMIEQEATEIMQTNAEMQKARLVEFANEVNAQGVELPQVLYQPTVRKESAAYDRGEYDADAEGFASTNITAMCDADYAGNVKVIVQTGGAKRWQNIMVNPNRTQRFLIDESGMKEIYNSVLVNSATPEALGDFLTYCNENYEADHKVVVLWNHGGGTSGYGWDSIYGGHLSLADINKALAISADADPENPPYEAIGFDACLMANTDVCHKLYGFAKYLYASEEVEPGAGWDYTAMINALSEKPGMNGAQLGAAIADSYIKNSVKETAEEMGYIFPATFSVTDLNEAESVYKAYESFAEATLKKIAEEPGALAALSRASRAAVAYAQNTYRVYNLIDLGMFMQECGEFLPEESKTVLDALDRAVLYTRNSSYLKESMGLSVYFPARIEGTGGLSTFTDYMDLVSDSEGITALYYYKIAGCLNDALREYTDESIGEIGNIDYKSLKNLGDLDVKCSGDGNLSAKVGENEMPLLQDVRFGIAKYDEESGDIVYYGEDVFSFLDEDRSVRTDFKGKWISLGGKPLPLEVISKTGEQAMYLTPVNYNGWDGWLITGYDAENDEVSILGVRIDLDVAGGADRALIPLKMGDIIMIKYEAGNLYSNIQTEETESVIYRPGLVKLEEQVLEDGTYYEYLLFEDLRSDTYYSKVAGFTMTEGTISDQAIDPDVITYDKGE